MLFYGTLNNFREIIMQLKRLAIIFVALEAGDGFLTMWATRHGFTEVNPLAAPLAQTWLFPVWKIGGAILGLVILIPLAKRVPKLVKIGLASASIFLLAVISANLYELCTCPIS